MLNKAELIGAAIEYGHIDEYRDRKHYIPGETTAEMAKGYNDYVNEAFDNLSDDTEAIKDIMNGVWGSFEEFLDDQPFMLEFVITGKAEVHENRGYVEWLEANQICEGCHELHDWCICHENEDEDDEDDEDLEDEYWND